MRTLTLIAVCVVLSGCGWWERFTAVTVGNSEQCIDGVKYIQFSSGASVKYDRTGKIVGCN